MRPADTPKADFDFEEALAKFNKADVQQEQVCPAAPRLFSFLHLTSTFEDWLRMRTCRLL